MNIDYGPSQCPNAGLNLDALALRIARDTGDALDKALVAAQEDSRKAVNPRQEAILATMRVLE